MFAVDDGIFSGNFNLADIAFLVALILFIIAFVVAQARRSMRRRRCGLRLHRPRLVGSLS
jgi:hypothetical protein